MFKTLPHPTNNTTSLLFQTNNIADISLGSYLLPFLSIFKIHPFCWIYIPPNPVAYFWRSFANEILESPGAMLWESCPYWGESRGSRPALWGWSYKTLPKNPQMSAGRDKIIFQTIIFRFYVNLVGCLQPCKYHLHFSLLITRLQSSIRQAFQRPQFQWPSRCWHRLHLLHAMAKCCAVTPALEKTPAGFEKRGGVTESNDFLPQNQRKPSKFVDIFGFFKTLRIYSRQVI